MYIAGLLISAIKAHWPSCINVKFVLTFLYCDNAAFLNNVWLFLSPWNLKIYSFGLVLVWISLWMKCIPRRMKCNVQKLLLNRKTGLLLESVCSPLADCDSCTRVVSKTILPLIWKQHAAHSGRLWVVIHQHQRWVNTQTRWHLCAVFSLRLFKHQPASKASSG